MERGRERESERKRKRVVEREGLKEGELKDIFVKEKPSCSTLSWVAY